MELRLAATGVAYTVPKEMENSKRWWVMERAEGVSYYLTDRLTH